jgi:hypothetical protein
VAGVLLALTGLVLWVIHLLFGSPAWGWAALGGCWRALPHWA